MSCVTRFQFLRGTTAQRMAFTPLPAEIVVDTSMPAVFVGDGVTPGGVPLPAAIPNLNIQIYNSDQTLITEDAAIANSATPITFTLPDASTYKRRITLKNKGAGVLTVLPLSGQTIDGLSDIQLEQTNAVDLIPKNGEWFIC